MHNGYQMFTHLASKTVCADNRTSRMFVSCVYPTER